MITSRHDKIVNLALGDIWRSGIRGAQQRELTGSGHLADLEAPAELADLITDFALQGVAV